MPVRNDYMMRLIEQLSETVGVLLGMRKRQEPEKEVSTIDEALKRMLGLNARLVTGLSEPDLVALLTKDGYGELERLAAVAVLLKEEGDAFTRMGQERSAYAARKKALYLLLHIGSRGAEPSFLKLHQEIEDLLTLLGPYEMPSVTRRELWLYYEEIGRYADAEDVLFELLEEGPERQTKTGNMPGWGSETEGESDIRMVDKSGSELKATAHSSLVIEAVAFYERLARLDEAKLAAGNLPLNEVEDSLRELRAKFGR